MAALSMDLRERILASYDRGEGTRDQIASRYKVSLGMVKKLIQRRRHSGDIAARHHLSGRKPLILESHKKAMKELLARRPDMTLEELREATGLSCTLPAIHYALAAMGLTYKKRRSAPASRTAPTSSKPAGSGVCTKVVSIPQSLSSSTKAGRRPT